MQGASTCEPQTGCQVLERRERAGNGPDGEGGQEGTAGIPRLHFLAPYPHAHTPPHIPAITSQLPPLTKESRHSEEDLPPALASPPQEATPGVGSSPPCRCQHRGWGASRQFPECSLPFLGDHHSLVMFALMSYMLISHGPSPPLRMGLWGDILSHPLASKDQMIPRKRTAPIPAWQAASTSPSPSVGRSLPGPITGSQLCSVPGKPYLPAESFQGSSATRSVNRCGFLGRYSHASFHFHGG